MDIMTKICTKCHKEKQLTAFRPSGKRHKDGTRSRRSICCVCDDYRRYHNPDSVLRRTRAKQLEKYKRSYPERIIVRSARSMDKKKNRSGFDIDNEYVRQLISNGCVYCGARDIQMSIDRIDNNLAHTKANTNACCVRCNHIRGSMPYEAWIAIVPAIKQAYVSGLFGNWWTDTKHNTNTKFLTKNRLNGG